MVYAFFVGMVVGLPVGCYIREKGYASKMHQAYNLFSPANDERKMD